MTPFQKELNTVALDVALEGLMDTKGRDNAKRVYELIDNAMKAAFAAGAASRNDELAKDRQEMAEHIAQNNHSIKETIQQAERVGYEKGHASALFAQAVEDLNRKAGEIDPCLLPGAEPVHGEETALVNAVSALG